MHNYFSHLLFLIHVYLIYMCLHTELLSKLSDVPDSYGLPPCGVLTSVASSWLMHYIFSPLFWQHNHSTTRDLTALSFPSICSISLSFSVVPSLPSVVHNLAHQYPSCFIVAILLVHEIFERQGNILNMRKAFLTTSRSRPLAKHFFVKLLQSPCPPHILL